MWAVDYFSAYLFGLKYLAILVSILIVISSLDDFLIDMIYWVRQLWRSLTVYRVNKKSEHHSLYEHAEKPLAIMVPAWHETGVIGHMAELAATTLEYENYHIFVGTYPNDPDTQMDVDKACAIFPNVHKVVCARPGPTSKADCLNNVLNAILQFEQSANLSFAGFILHDAEDVTSSMELLLFNYLVSKFDLIQIPVYPFERHWTNFTSMHYLDEFTEIHGKDILVREAIAGQVPSAGVGTCFSRRAIMALLSDGDGIAFDAQSLTEDYDIGFRLKAKGMKEIFVRFPVVKEKTSKKLKIGQDIRESNVICVREYFPDTLQNAIRQKSRWITGIVFQGYKTHGWTSNWILNYFLWRDRKGAITNFVSFTATLILFQLIVLLLYQQYWPNAYHFLSIFSSDPIFVALIWLNGFFMANRILQRVYFVSSYYGFFQGLMSIPRLFWANYINFMANWRAIKQIIQQGDSRRVAWDKTMHDFPTIGEENRERRLIGKLLIERELITEEQLEAVFANKENGLKIGNWLIRKGLITSTQLAQTLANQSGVPFESIDAYTIPQSIINLVPAKIAEHYAVIPICEDGDKLVLASESNIDPVSLAAISRKLNRKVSYVISPTGQVTVGLRHFYAQKPTADPREILNAEINTGELTPEEAKQIWDNYVSQQILLGDILISLGQIATTALKALLLQFEKSDSLLGDFLVKNKIISQETAHKALEIQSQLQPAIEELIKHHKHSKIIQKIPIDQV